MGAPLSRPWAKGPRVYDWALINIDHDIDHDAERPGHRWLLIRRNNTTAELAYYRCYSPQLVPLSVLVKVAGRRWTVEESFQAGRTPSPDLDLLAVLDDPVHARARLPRRHRLGRTITTRT